MIRITDEFLSQVCRANPSPWDDQRYMVRSPSSEELAEIPERYDGLFPYFKAKYYQGNIGSCVGHSVSAVLEVTNYLLDQVDDDLSAWDCYVKARKYDGLPDWKEGSNLLGAMKALHKLGICTETCWPTITDKSADPGEPCVSRDSESWGYGIDSYWQVPVTPGAFKAAIWGTTHRMAYDMPDGSQGKTPLIVAFKVHDSFKEGYDDGIVPRVLPGDKFLGYHASIIRGWRFINGERYWVNQGTWGTGVGDCGVFYLPENFDIIEGFLIHNGPPTGPSSCPLGNGITSVLNWGAKALHRRGRFEYMNP